MKYQISFLLFSILLSCKQNQTGNENNQSAVNKDSLQKVLFNVDRSWSDSALVKGYYKSRLDFVAENATELLDGEMPLNGRKAIEDYANTHPDSTFTIQWRPLKAEVSSSGDMASTYGSWAMKTKTKAGKDTMMYGDYITVWQRQTDGTWKYILDGGNGTPMEVKE